MRISHFGVSGGFLSERIIEEDVVGTEGDMSIRMANQRETNIDGDFGVAFTSKRLSLEMAVPNINNFLKRGDRISADWATYYSAVSYRFSLSQGLDAVTIEPKLSYRGIKGVDNVWDICTEFGLADSRINVFGIYHSSRSMTFGMGVSTLKEKVTFLGVYTTETSALRGNTSGNFEINMKVRVF